MNTDLDQTIEYPHKRLVIELDESFASCKENIEKNTEFPTIDVEALLDNLFDTIQSDEAYSSSSRQDDIDYLLQETFAVGQFNQEMVTALHNCIDMIITSVMNALHKAGAFINGLQPYNFSKFIDNRTLLLVQSKVFSYRDEQCPPTDTTPRRHFVF